MFRFFIALLLGISFAAPLHSQAPETKPAGPPAKLTADQKEFIALTEAMQKAYDEMYAAAEKIDESERARFYDEKEPAIEFAPKLEALEKKHHGKDLGLMIARRLILLGVGGGRPDNPRDLARRRMLATLPDYAGFDVLPEILRYFDAGNTEPATEGCLRAVMASPSATKANRQFAKYMLSTWSIANRDGRDYAERRLAELSGGDKERWPNEKEGLEIRLKSELSREKLLALEKEALANLKDLEVSGAAYKQPAVRGIDERYLLLAVDAEATKSRPLISDLAKGVLFKEKHLRPGKPAPELDLQFTTGKSWSLADQKGKCVIIQFSFKGCGPCEAMYPDLRDLAKEHGDKLSVVSIMADQTREETIEAVDTGKITWGAHFDGHRGPLCTKWAVKGFPTVYVVDRDGNMVADVGRGDRMKTKIAELCR